VGIHRDCHRWKCKQRPEASVEAEQEKRARSDLQGNGDWTQKRCGRKSCRLNERLHRCGAIENVRQANEQQRQSCDQSCRDNVAFMSC
jgi:hypothetical protein